MSVITPMAVESRLRELGRELDAAHDDLVEAERTYFFAKGEYEVGIAAARINEGARAANRGVKATVQEKEDAALLATADLLKRLYTAEAVVRAARANTARLRVQIDIARSVGTSVRASMDLT